MNIPSRVNPFGYDNSLPPGYFRVEFLESTGTQYIDIVRPLTIAPDCSFVYKAQKTGGDSGYQHAFGARVAANSKEFGVSYYIPSSTITVMLGGGYGVSIPYNLNDVHEVVVNGATGTVTCGDNVYSIQPVEISMTYVGVFRRANIGYSYFRGRIFNASIFNGGSQFFKLVPAINPAGVSCMYDSVTGNAYINSGSGKFIAGCTMGQAESLGSVIPPNTTLTVSFPWEAKLVQYNSRVEYSLEQARNKGCTISVQYRDPEQYSAIYNKYAECETVADMVAVNPNYKTDLTIEGAWEYPLPKLRDADMAFKDSPIRKFSVTLPALVNGKQFFCGTALEGEMTIDLPSISKVGSSQMFVATTSNERKLTKLTINAKPGSACHQIVNTWTVSDHYLEELNLTGFTAPWYNGDAVAARHYALKRFRIDAVGCVAHWNGAFSHSILDKESILNIVRATIIPADPMVVSQNITSHIGIHVDYKTDEEVLAAISTLEAGGHKLSIRWNGTPTSGVSLMDLEEIWCKVVEKEDGEYVNENGIRCDIDWGHYVTDTSAYKLFFSLAEAEEYYKLVKVV